MFRFVFERERVFFGVVKKTQAQTQKKGRKKEEEKDWLTDCD